MSNKELDDIALAEALERVEQARKRQESADALRGCGMCLLGLLVIADIIFVHSALAWLLL